MHPGTLLGFLGLFMGSNLHRFVLPRVYTDLAILTVPFPGFSPCFFAPSTLIPVAILSSVKAINSAYILSTPNLYRL